MCAEYVTPCLELNGIKLLPNELIIFAIKMKHFIHHIGK